MSVTLYFISECSLNLLNTEKAYTDSKRRTGGDIPYLSDSKLAHPQTPKFSKMAYGLELI
jgi:hypothetical protein